MRIRPSVAFTRLSLLVTSVVLLTSRVALVLHEFAGHGATATFFGGRITGWYLFLFAGGRVSYEIASLDVGPRLAISLGGIALELVLGAAALLVARRTLERPVVTFCALSVGTVLVGHGAMYLARGVHYGFGDGALVSRLLGEKRIAIVLALSALAVATALYAGRRLAALPAALLAGPRWRVAGVTLLVFVASGVVHGGLAWSEVRWFPDPRWVAVMEDASVSAARAELGRRLAEGRTRGEEPPGAAEQQRILDALERARRPWPLDPVLGGAVVLALALGVARGSRPSPNGAAAARLPSWRLIGAVAGALAVACGVIFVLRQLSPHG